MEKIYQNNHYEQENQIESDVCPPLVDVLRDADRAAALWPEYAEELRPQIERHTENAQKITEYLDDLVRGEATMFEKERFYDAASELLQNPEQERIALFLPFESFPAAHEASTAARNFRKTYLEAWVDLLQVRDVRANFVDGDVLEVDARSSEPERVVKAAHLAPWLVQNGMISVSEILTVAREDDDELLVRNFLETGNTLDDFGLLSDDEKAEFQSLERALPAKSPVAPPKYISLARQTWLVEKARGLKRPDQVPADVDLGRSMSSRLPALTAEVVTAKKILADLPADETYGVAWLGGSRLKGYNTEESDTDLWIPTKSNALELEGVDMIPLEELKQDPPRFATRVFNFAWVGEPDRIQDLQQTLLPIYFTENNLQTRKMTTEYIERSLLEYRLLHKGYPRLYPDTNPEYKKYTKIDGQSAFYETGYRILATKLFANSVFVPRVKV